MREIQIDLVKLSDGARLLRLSQPTLGLCLEKKLDPRQPVAKQKQHWLGAFHALLARESVAVTA